MGKNISVYLNDELLGLIEAFWQTCRQGHPGSS
jgi:hypothetical protein